MATGIFQSERRARCDYAPGSPMRWPLTRARRSCGAGERTPDDTSNSGWRFALAEALKSIGGFGPEDFASILYCWDRRPGKDHAPHDRARLDPGRIAGANVGDRPTASEAEFPAAPVLPPIKWTRAQANGRAWCQERPVGSRALDTALRGGLLYGDGGIGKTLAIHQYATPMTAGRSQNRAIDAASARPCVSSAKTA